MYFSGVYDGTSTGTIIRAVNSSNVASTVGTLPVTNGDAAFLCKFDSSGTYQYSRLVDSASGEDSATDIACDSSRNVYIILTRNGSTNIRSVSNSNVVTTVGTLPTGFASVACKFDSNGTYQYSRMVAGGNNSVGGISCDSFNNMYFACTYSGAGLSNILSVNSSNIASNVGTLPISSTSSALVCKFDSGGTYQYSRIINGSGTDSALGSACDAYDNMYIVGECRSSNILSVSSLNVVTTVGTIPVVPIGGNMAFACKFDQDGNYAP
jgi:hypothetical protein